MSRSQNINFNEKFAFSSMMVFGNKPGKKDKSLLILDHIKNFLLNTDFKIMTDIKVRND